MSVSQHPIALRLERQVGEGTRLLATVMALPLLDGIFPALVLAGAIDSALGIAEIGLLVFGGSATLAVVLAEMDGTRRERVGSILFVGAVVLCGAALEAALAPTIRGLVDLATFERFAALVILAVAAKTASSRLGEWLPRPALIIALGLVASVDPGGASLALIVDPSLVARGVAAAAVGVGFALSVALLGPTLREAVDLDRFRFGSAVALGILPLSILGVIPNDAPLALAVLAVTSLLAFDPWQGGRRSVGDEASAVVGEQASSVVEAGRVDPHDEADPHDEVDPPMAGDPAVEGRETPSAVHRSESSAGGQDGGSTVDWTTALWRLVGSRRASEAERDGSNEAEYDVESDAVDAGADDSEDGSNTPGLTEDDRAPWL